MPSLLLPSYTCKLMATLQLCDCMPLIQEPGQEVPESSVESVAGTASDAGDGTSVPQSSSQGNATDLATAAQGKR